MMLEDVQLPISALMPAAVGPVRRALVLEAGAAGGDGSCYRQHDEQDSVLHVVCL